MRHLLTPALGALALAACGSEQGSPPANQTQIATTWMIQFVQNGSYGLGSALGLILMGILALFTVFYLMALKRGDR